MTGAALVLAVLALLATAGGWAWSLRSSVLRSTLRERVIVTLKTGEAFDGVLYAADRQTWELRGTKALGAGDRGTDVPVDGTLLILAADVAYSQRP